MVGLRSRDHAEILHALTAAGEQLDDGQSVMATVHKAAVDLRSALTSFDQTTLELFITGEESILERYDAAISEAEGPIADLLRQQKADLAGKVFAMRSMA